MPDMLLLAGAATFTAFYISNAVKAMCPKPATKASAALSVLIACVIWAIAAMPSSVVPAEVRTALDISLLGVLCLFAKGATQCGCDDSH